MLTALSQVRVLPGEPTFPKKFDDSLLIAFFVCFEIGNTEVINRDRYLVALFFSASNHASTSALS